MAQSTYFLAFRSLQTCWCVCIDYWGLKSELDVPYLSGQLLKTSTRSRWVEKSNSAREPRNAVKHAPSFKEVIPVVWLTAMWILIDCYITRSETQELTSLSFSTDKLRLSHAYSCLRTLFEVSPLSLKSFSFFQAVSTRCSQRHCLVCDYQTMSN